jgi:hypothetical protein
LCAGPPITLILHLLLVHLQTELIFIVGSVDIVTQDQPQQIRKLMNGRQATQLDSAVHLTVITKCPEKYILIDQETGQSYVGSDHESPYLPGFKLWIEIKD